MPGDKWWTFSVGDFASPYLQICCQKISFIRRVSLNHAIHTSINLLIESCGAILNKNAHNSTRTIPLVGHCWKVRKTQEKIWGCCVHTWCAVIAEPEGCPETVVGVSGGDDLCFSEEDDDSDFGDFGEVSSASTAPDPPSTSTALSATYTSLHDLMRQVRKAHFIYRLRPVEPEILIIFPPNPVRHLWGIIEAPHLKDWWPR